jgi:hypothetical protein
VGEAEEIPLFFTLIPVLALLSNYDRENCLINVGTEGQFHPPAAHIQPTLSLGCECTDLRAPASLSHNPSAFTLEEETRFRHRLIRGDTLRKQGQSAQNHDPGNRLSVAFTHH